MDGFYYFENFLRHWSDLAIFSAREISVRGRELLNCCFFQGSLLVAGQGYSEKNGEKKTQDAVHNHLNF